MVDPAAWRIRGRSIRPTSSLDESVHLLAPGSYLQVRCTPVVAAGRRIPAAVAVALSAAAGFE
jgi:hypothetical protein